MKVSLLDVYSDEGGTLDFGRVRGMSKSKEATKFISAAVRTANAKQNALFTTAEVSLSLRCIA